MNRACSTIGVVDLHSFLTSALDQGVRSASHPGRFAPEKEPAVSVGQDAGCGRKKHLVHTGN
jgi:hypothetical protein